MTSPAEIEQQLPSHIAPRIRSVRFAEGVATLVADASGLSRADAAALQRELEQTVGAMAGVSEVRVALMADKVRRRIIVVGSG
jgi:ATP-binding protein involved in chromosome partitioning